MHHLLITVLFFVLASGTTGCDQIETPPDELIPLQPGQLWTYRNQADTTVTTYSVSLHQGYFVSEVDSLQYQFRRPTGHPFVGLGMLVLLPRIEGPVLVTNYTGVCCPDEIGVAINHRLLKYPVMIGEEYENIYGVTQGGGGSYLVRVSEEVIETEMGQFDVLVYSSERSSWYVKPGLGIVRIRDWYPDGEVRWTSDLIDYYRGY